MKPAPLRPSSPERICWGCDRYCPAHDLGCGGGTIRTPHPIEMFGEEWAAEQESTAAASRTPASAGDEPLGPIGTCLT